MDSTISLPKLRILIVEDNDDDADLMVAELRRANIRAETTRVRNEAEFRAALATPPDAIVSDYTIPGFGARRALQVCAELKLTIPFIVVTGSISEEVAVDCMKRGADDYLLKDRLTRLGSALEQAISARAQRALKLRAERARDAAMQELDHRVRNNLAVVVGLAELSMKSALTLESFAPIFMGRVRALATVHDALSEQQWLEVDLSTLVTRIVQPHASSGAGRLQVDGEPIRLSAHTVQPLGLALYELSRNAIQRGTWDTSGGSVRISWSRTADHGLSIVWQESIPSPIPAGSPAPDSPGLDLVGNLVRSEIGGTITLGFGPQGFLATLALPSHALFESARLVG